MRACLPLHHKSKESGMWSERGRKVGGTDQGTHFQVPTANCLLWVTADPVFLLQSEGRHTSPRYATMSLTVRTSRLRVAIFGAKTVYPGGRDCSNSVFFFLLHLLCWDGTQACVCSAPLSHQPSPCRSAFRSTGGGHADCELPGNGRLDLPLSHQSAFLLTGHEIPDARTPP